MENPVESIEWAPVVLEPNAPTKAQTALHHRHGIEAVCVACEILTLRARVQELEAAEWRWRSALWYRHGCPFPALYGDDGEMQCAACSIDFKRASVEDIEARWRTIGALLTTPTKKVMPFMLPAPMPATPIPPDPRDAVVEAAATVLEGFDQGVFVRDITGDHEFGWAMKLLPYIVALGKLQEAVDALHAAEDRG